MLGGDAHHTVLVKGELVETLLDHLDSVHRFTHLLSLSSILPGLDFALLEQRKAKLVQNQAAADDDLESAFLEASVSVPKKKTRDELVMELKQARSVASTGHMAQDGLERAKIAGKFKPIGAPDKPAEKEKTKKKKRAKDGTDDGERRKKKRKIESKPTTEVQRMGDENDKIPEQKIPKEIAKEDAEVTRLSPTKQKTPTPPPMDDDGDIFADAGEYKGLEISDGEEERPKTQSKLSAPHSPAPGVPNSKPTRDWFRGPVEPDQPSAPLEPSSIAPASVVPSFVSRRNPQSRREEHEDGLIEGAKLRGLASSAVPSIKDILAMDEAAEREEKRKAKKEKKKAKKLSEDAKLNKEVKK